MHLSFNPCNGGPWPSRDLAGPICVLEAHGMTPSAELWKVSEGGDTYFLAAPGKYPPMPTKYLILVAIRINPFNIVW